LNDIYEIRKF